MVTKNELLRETGESARNSLAWELVAGDTLIVEHALEELVSLAIQADRQQRDIYEMLDAMEERYEQ